MRYGGRGRKEKMIAAGGDDSVRGASNSDHATQYIIPRLLSEDPTLTQSILDYFVSGSAAPAYGQGLLQLVTEPVRFTGYAFMPDLFGLVPRVNVKPEVYADFQRMDSYSGSAIYVKTDVEGKVVIGGRLGDLASFLNAAIGKPGVWSPGMLASMIRGNSRPSLLADRTFGDGELVFIPMYNYAARLYQVTISPDHDLNFPADFMWYRFHAAMKFFMARSLYDIEESTNDVTYLGIINAFHSAMQDIQSGQAKRVERFLNTSTLLRAFAPDDMIGIVGAGVRLNPEGKVMQLTLRVGGLENEALWTGILGRNGKTIYWHVENSRPENVTRRSQRAFVENDIAPLFHRSIRNVYSGDYPSRQGSSVTGTFETGETSGPHGGRSLRQYWSLPFAGYVGRRALVSGVRRVRSAASVVRQNIVNIVRPQAVKVR